MTRNDYYTAHRAFRTANPRKPTFGADGMLTKGNAELHGNLRLYRRDETVSVYRAEPTVAFNLGCASMILCFCNAPNKSTLQAMLDVVRGPQFRGSLPLPA